METRDENEKLSIVFVGHVDHGKSTVIGRLLADTGALPAGKLEQIQAYCGLNSMPFEYAFLIDALKDERRQNITIDSARVFFKTARRHYIIIDAPGHIELVKNMVTGAARAEAALLVIDAQEGIQENSRRHGNLLSMLGIHQMVVLVNKMDLVEFNQTRYRAICKEFGVFLSKVGLEPAGYIPVSARLGDNISRRSTNMSWYDGPTVLEALDAFKKEQPLDDRPFRLPIQDVYRFTAFGDNRRIIAGTVASGRARVGDEIIFFPSGKRSRIAAIEGFNRPAQQEVVSGQATGLTLDQQVYVKRGEVVIRAEETPPRVTRRLRVNLFWLGKEPLIVGKSYIIKLGTDRTRFQVERILRVVDASRLEDETDKVQVDRYEMSECILALDHPMAVDRADVLPGTSRFVIVDTYEIRGGGMVLEDLPDAETDLRAGVQARDTHWIPSALTIEDRAERYDQRPGLVLITGQKGSGRKQLARALEARLFQDGKFVYYLGMGSVVYGVDGDIHNHQEIENRREHVRRMAEIANIFLDAGLILIITAVELTQADLRLFETVVESERIQTIWVGETISTDIRPDLRVDNLEANGEAVILVKRSLQNNGFLFEPKEGRD
jgi:bifunctional enzyme CysN/CysC